MTGEEEKGSDIKWRSITDSARYYPFSAVQSLRWATIMPIMSGIIISVLFLFFGSQRWDGKPCEYESVALLISFSVIEVDFVLLCGEITGPIWIEMVRYQDTSTQRNIKAVPCSTDQYLLHFQYQHHAHIKYSVWQKCGCLPGLVYHQDGEKG
jgi:hypothetical protein